MDHFSRRYHESTKKKRSLFLLSLKESELYGLNHNYRSGVLRFITSNDRGLKLNL